MSDSIFTPVVGMIVTESTTLFDKSADLIQSITPIFTAGFGIYILLLCFYYYNKGIDESILDLSKRMIAWLIIIAFGFNAGNYAKIATIAYQLPEGLASAVSGQEFSTSAIDIMFSESKKTFDHILELSSKLNWKMIGDKLLLGFATQFFVICTLFYFGIIIAFYLIAKISLAMVLLTGPLFIGFLLFPATRQWGMNWIGQIMNYAITVTFYVVLVGIQQRFFQDSLQNALTGSNLDVVQIFGMIPLFLFSTLVFVIIAWNVPTIATALFQGASIQAFGRQIVSAASATSKYVGNMNTHRSPTDSIKKG